MLRLRLLRRTDSLCTRVAPWALAEKGPEVRLNGFGSNRFRGDRLMRGGPAPYASSAMGVLSSKASPCLSRNLESRCFERERLLALI